MKLKRLFFMCFMAAALGVAAQEQVNLGLIPTPQQVADVDSSRMVNLAKAKVVERHARDLRGQVNADQYYSIRFEPKKITVTYCSQEGLQYAYMTLAQLKLLHAEVPSMTINDWPAYRYRGWMDDISRGPVPHWDYRDRQWQVLHALKYNFCNYYTEHTLYQKEFPDLAPAYADAPRYPDEVINLQLFAHAEKTFRVPYYQYMMDGRANFNPDTEATYDFLRKRIAEAFRQMPQSPFFIIDCDETEQLGTGRAKALVDRKGADQVYVDHINRCYNLVKEAGDTRVVMWGDIVAKNPAMMRQLPQDMTYIMWAYEPLDSYDHLIRPFKDNGTPFWVAPSLSHSSNMIPSPQRYMKNIANLARDGFRNGAEGLMNTCWDDNGEALFDNCWHGLFWSAEMAWNPIRTDDPEEYRRREQQFNENYDRLCRMARPFGRAEQSATLYAVGALEGNPVIGDWYTSAALLEPLLNFNPDNTSVQMAARATNAAFDLIDIDSATNPHAHYAIARMQATALKSTLRIMIYQHLSGTDNADVIRYYSKLYLQTLFDLKREYLRLWDQECGDYERYIVLNRYDDLAREVLELDRHVFVQVGCDAVSQHPTVTLRTLGGGKDIYYTLDGSEPTMASTLYTGPFPLERSATIKAIAYNEYGEGVVTEQYLLSHSGMGAKITLNTPFATYKAIYSGGGEQALIDGQLGSNTTYADGHWQGYWGDSIDAVIDFGEPRDVHEVAMRFMQNTFDWILSPTRIKVYASADGKEWYPIAEKDFDMDPRETGMRLKNYVVPLPSHLSSYTHLRVVVPNPGPLPSWHPAPGQPSYMFTDEIVVK